MELMARTMLATTVLMVATLAGCVTPIDKASTATIASPLAAGDALRVTIDGVMNFTPSVVKPAVAVSNDLYEPTMEVSDTGAIYATAHVIGAATTGSPAYVSNDHGKTWTQLPFVASVSSPVQGATPPPGDEGVIVAGEKGAAYM